jgi:N-acetylglucosaminyl-diphospho-decaprenol L-rhamnosyltransferase
MGSKMQPLISVVIVSYNTAALLADCLASLEGQRGLIREVVVVDNASSDDSVSVVKQRFPDVRLIAGTENIGFGRANNLAAGQCGGELLFLLNPDTRIEPGCIQAMIAYMEEHPEIGMAGTATFNDDGAPEPTAQSTYPGHNYAKDAFARLPGDIAWLLGSGLVVRRRVWEQIKGFDPDYFLYGEDVDLGLRVRKAGWPLGYAAEARIVHIGGQSERKSDPAAVFEKKMRGELLFYRKHYPAATVRKIIRIRRLEAWWRRLTLRLAFQVGGDFERNRLKLIKYQVTSRVFRLDGGPQQ